MMMYFWANNYNLIYCTVLYAYAHSQAYSSDIIDIICGVGCDW